MCETWVLRHTCTKMRFRVVSCGKIKNQNMVRNAFVMFNTEKHVKSIDFSYNSILYQYPLSERELKYVY